MLILPIINYNREKDRNRIMEIQITLKDAKKIYSSVILENTSESEVVINHKFFSESSYSHDKSDSSVVDFIRNSSLVSKNDFLITTREEADSNRYDVYQVKQPPKFVNKALDNLYASVITDMRKNIPNGKGSHKISFEKLGFDEVLTEEKINRLREIVKTNPDRSQWPRLFEQAGIDDLSQTLEFLDHFNFTIIKESIRPEELIESVIQSFESSQSQEYRVLKKYHNIAKSNQQFYSKLSLVNHLLYNQPYHLITSDKSREFAGRQESQITDYEQARQKIKVANEGMEVADYGKAA